MPDDVWQIEPYQVAPVERRKPTGFLRTPDRKPAHACAPPVRERFPPVYDQPPFEPAARAGSVWRCACLRLWVVIEVQRQRWWVRAGWLTRWRYRRAESVRTGEDR